MYPRILLIALAALVLGGCTVPFTAVEPGPVTVADMQFSTQATWNQAASTMSPFSRKDAQVWTRDGLLLNRLLIIPAVPAGEPIFSVPSKTAALPVFRTDMLPNEIEELVESSMVKLLGEGASTVSTSNLRPVKYGERRGVMFDFTGRLTDGPDYKGLVGSVVANDQLYLMIYFGADPHYFDKHRDEAEAMIRSVRI